MDGVPPPPHSSLTSEDTVQTPGPRRAVELSVALHLSARARHARPRALQFLGFALETLQLRRRQICVIRQAPIV
ncbi:hypothetical protein J6590_100221 [Homalodisca vitripennis]|nr:hypothetical protein J6590_100221 [Homalodisca vitripennis]